MKKVEEEPKEFERDENGELIYAIREFEAEPYATRDRYTNAGEKIIARILLKNKKQQEGDLETDFDAVFEAIATFYVLPAILAERAAFRNMLSEANADIRNNRLHHDETLLRLLVSLDHPIRAKTIEEDERSDIVKRFQRGWSISMLSRVYRRSKSTIHAVVQGIQPPAKQ